MDLATLIVTAKGDRSYDRLAADCGGSPGAARLQQLATRPVRNFPDPPTIASLASGLGVSQRTVVLAAAESLGIDVGEGVGSLATLLPPSAADLTERQVAAVLGVVRAMADPASKPAGTDEAGPTEDPRATITAIDERRARPPAEKRAARRPKDGPPQDYT